MSKIDGQTHASSTHRHVGDMDAVLWRVEEDPLLRNTITVVMILDRPPDRKTLADRLDYASRTLPGFRHRLVEPPLRLSTPLWLVDPDFDLSYHFRWIGAPGDGSPKEVFEFARQSTMSGLDKQRPLWTATIVEGLERGQAALILKMHHVLTDGQGALAAFAVLCDLTRQPRDLGPLPAIPEPEPQTRLGLAAQAAANSGGRILGLLGAAAQTVPHIVLHPRETASNATKNVLALARTLKPSSKSLSPLMIERRGWLRFATLEHDLAALHKAAKSRSYTVNDAFVTAVAHGLALYHQRHGEPVDRLRMTIAVSTRKPGDPSLGNRVTGRPIVIPIIADDPAGAMEIYHGLMKGLIEDVKRPMAAAIGTALNAFGPAVGRVFGQMMRHNDCVISNVAVGNFTAYLAGAKILDIFGFGPLVGAAVNCTLVGYDSKASIGISFDAAAVSDGDVLVECIREGLDAVIALGGISDRCDRRPVPPS